MLMHCVSRPVWSPLRIASPCCALCSDGILRSRGYTRLSDSYQPSATAVTSWVRSVLDYSAAGLEIVVSVGLVDAKAEAAIDPNTVCVATYTFGCCARYHSSTCRCLSV